jgi:hypothetical protein
MELVTFGPVTLNNNEIEKDLSAKFEKCRETPKLAIVYVPIGADIKNIVKMIKKISGVPVIGATTGGASFTEKGIGMNSISGGFLCGDEVVIQPEKIIFNGNDYSGETGEFIKKIKPAKEMGHTLFILADAMSCDGEKFIKELSKTVPIHWRIFGGFAGDNWMFKNTKVFLDDDVFEGGAVITYINAGVQTSIGVRHGFEPVPGLREMRITKSENNIIHTIDDLPATEAYRQELEKHSVIKKGEDIMSLFAQYPVGVKMLTGEKLKIRTPMSISGSSIILAGSLNTGDKIQIMHGTKDSMIAAVREMTSEASKGLKGSEPKFQLVIDCAGRRMMLGENYKDQIKAIRVGQNCPMLGFASYGEFARYGGSLEGFHNTTAVVAVW